MDLRLIGQAKLRVNGVGALLHCRLGEHQGPRDGRIGLAFGQVCKTSRLRGGSRPNRRVRQAGPSGKQQLDNTRIDDRASRRYLFEGAQQLVEIADPVFEQVSQSVRAVL